MSPWWNRPSPGESDSGSSGREEHSGREERRPSRTRTRRPRRPPESTPAESRERSGGNGDGDSQPRHRRGRRRRGGRRRRRTPRVALLWDLSEVDSAGLSEALAEAEALIERSRVEGDLVALRLYHAEQDSAPVATEEEASVEAASAETEETEETGEIEETDGTAETEAARESDEPEGGEPEGDQPEDSAATAQDDESDGPEELAVSDGSEDDAVGSDLSTVTGLGFELRLSAAGGEALRLQLALDAVELCRSERPVDKIVLASRNDALGVLVALLESRDRTVVDPWTEPPARPEQSEHLELSEGSESSAAGPEEADLEVVAAADEAVVAARDTDHDGDEEPLHLGDQSDHDAKDQEDDSEEDRRPRRSRSRRPRDRSDDSPRSGGSRAPSVRRRLSVDEVFDLFERAVREVCEADNGRVVWATLVRQQMQRMEASFDEELCGFDDFTTLLEECERRGLVQLAFDSRTDSHYISAVCSQ